MTQILKEGSQKLLIEALEIEEYISLYKHFTEKQGHRLVVCNGHCPRREIQAGIGANC